MKPFGNRVLVKPIKQKPVTKRGGLVLVEGDHNLEYGEIIDVGEGVKKDDYYYPIDLGVGDTVRFKKDFATEVSIDAVTHYIVHVESNIFAVGE